jgi:2-phospho-L-lactate guanylyltransferase
MPAPPVTVVIPLKPLGVAKSRLATVLLPAERQDLVLEMFHVVLSAALASKASQVIVLTTDAQVGALAEQEGALWVSEPGQGLNASLSYAFDFCWKRGQSPLFLPADLPRLQAQDVDGILAEWDGDRKLVISPSADERGTNALLLPRECPLELCFGIDSFRKHTAQATQKGLRWSVYHSDAVGFDIDTPEDLQIHRASSRVFDGAPR